jgi:hypothetical protein
MANRLQKTADPLALIIGGIVAVCGALGLFSHLGLDVDTVQTLEGGLLALAAGVRMAWERRNG